MRVGERAPARAHRREARRPRAGARHSSSASQQRGQQRVARSRAVRPRAPPRSRASASAGRKRPLREVHADADGHDRRRRRRRRCGSRAGCRRSCGPSTRTSFGHLSRGGQRRRPRERLGDGDGGRERAGRPTARRPGADARRSVPGRLAPGSSLPGAAATAAPGGLVVGDDDRAVGGALGREGEGDGLRGVHRAEAHDASERGAVIRPSSGSPRAWRAAPPAARAFSRSLSTISAGARSVKSGRASLRAREGDRLVGALDLLLEPLALGGQVHDALEGRRRSPMSPTTPSAEFRGAAGVRRRR